MGSLSHCVGFGPFQERMKLLGEIIDIEIYLQRPDETTFALDNGGVRGSIERGLLYPENQVIAAEISEGLHRLILSSAPQQDDDELANALQNVNISHAQDAEDQDMDGNDVGPDGV